MSKLTLSVDPGVIARAKAYAREQGTSVSGLVEKLLELAARPTGPTGDTPAVLHRLRGSLKRGSASDYHRYLERKYR